MSDDSLITVHSRKRACALCEQLSSSGVDLASTNRDEYDNFICAVCDQKHRAAAKLRKLAAQIPVTGKLKAT